MRASREKMKNSEKMNIQKQYFGSPTGVEVNQNDMKFIPVVVGLWQALG
jgi:hypothetical protein